MMRAPLRRVILVPAKVRTFVDHLARRIGRMPYWDKGL